MSVQCGIIGLPNVGKSTLFNVLTSAGIAAENYPFCTIEPNTGVVSVPDVRLDVLEKLVQPQKMIPAAMQFVDIAGLVRGASKGEGLGNQFLAHIRETDANIHVVRCFQDPDVPHVSDHIDPQADIETIETELCLADLQMIEKMLLKINKRLKAGDALSKKQGLVLQKAHDALRTGARPQRDDYDTNEWAILTQFQLITTKPTLYVANVDDNDSPSFAMLKTYLDERQMPYLPLSAALEAEIAELSASEKEDFLADLGLEEPGLNRLIRAAYRLLGLETFFTAGPKEVRAWTISKEMRAEHAAGVIHTDFIKHFIRAEVIAYQDFIRCGCAQVAKQKGCMRLEGKDYAVQDGDVIHFRIGRG